MENANSAASRMQNDGSKQTLIIATSIALIVVSTVGISLRLYARLAILHKIFTEDVLMVLGTMTAFGLSTVYIVGGFHGFGKHLDEISPSDLSNVLPNISFSVIFLWIVTMLLVKTSFLVLYLRLDQRRAMRWTVYILMFLVVSQNITFFIVQALSCMPPSFLKIGNETARRCWDPARVQMSYNVNSVLIGVLDTAIFAVPLFMLQSLELPTRQKYAVGALFAVGILPIIAGCLRSYYTWHAIDSSDPYYDLVEGAIWAQVELHLAILCGSASTFKVLLKGFGLSCCQNSDDEEATAVQSATEIQRHGTPELASNAWTTAWTDRQEKADLEGNDSPLSTPGSWRSLTPPPSSPSLIDQPPQEKETLVSRRLSRNPVLTRQNSSVARMPADLQLRFSSIDSRLEGKHAWVDEATPAEDEAEQDAQGWPLTEPHAVTTP